MKFNEVTWYSKLAAIIFFIGVFPALTFYIGTKYQEVVMQQNIQVPLMSIVHKQAYPMYVFEEFVQPNQNMKYELVKVSDREYKLNIDGFQTMMRINAHAEGAGQDSSKLIFDSYDEANSGTLYKKGDTLFTYTFGDTTKTLLVLKWDKLQPIDPKNKTGAEFVAL